jgi:hypothetical protein
MKNFLIILGFIILALWAFMATIAYDDVTRSYNETVSRDSVVNYLNGFEDGVRCVSDSTYTTKQIRTSAKLGQLRRLLNTPGRHTVVH